MWVLVLVLVAPPPPDVVGAPVDKPARGPELVGELPGHQGGARQEPIQEAPLLTLAAHVTIPAG